MFLVFKIVSNLIIITTNYFVSKISFYEMIFFVVKRTIVLLLETVLAFLSLLREFQTRMYLQKTLWRSSEISVFDLDRMWGFQVWDNNTVEPINSKHLTNNIFKGKKKVCENVACSLLEWCVIHVVELRHRKRILVALLVEWEFRSKNLEIGS